MNTPDKRTILAAALYGLTEQKEIETRKGVALVSWVDLSPEEQKPCVAAAEYLLGQSFGVAPQNINRAKLAATFEEAKIITVDANAAVDVFVNIATVLP